MVHTVGIVGITGNVGAPTVKALIKAAEDGKIKLVIFHRASTNLAGLNKGPNVEFRILNLDDPSETLEAAVKGVNVFVSTIGIEGLSQEPSLIDALAKSADLVTYIPPTYSTTWNTADYKDEYLGPIMKFVYQGLNKAKQTGVGITPVYTGVFDNYFFQIGYLGAAVKDNTVWANEQQLKNRIPITSLQHLGDAIARIATSDPQSIKNQGYSVVTFWPTGQELADLYAKINGKQAQVKDFTKADREAKRADVANFGAAPVGYWDKWENASWEYESGGKIIDTSYAGPDLEQVARSFA